MHKVVFLFIFLFIFLNCGINKQKINHTLKENEVKFVELKEKGNKEFKKMYWAGWKNAIDNYDKALKIKNDNNIKQKLFYSLLLISIREKMFEVRNYNYLERAKKLLPEIDNELNKIYLEIAREIVDLSFLSEKHKAHRWKDSKIFQKNLNLILKNVNSDYLYCFYIEYLGNHATAKQFKQFTQDRKNFSKKYPDTNLGVEFAQIPEDIEKKMEKYPDFIELILIQAEQLYRKGDFLQTEAKYKDIIKINYRVPAAHTGLGSIYFWLELYDEAIPYYNDALSINPCFSKALFGKAVSLHYKGNYEESNRMFSEMIEKQTFYHGEAYYYTALNNYYLNKYKEIDMNIIKAEAYMPDSIELNAFAGIFYYHSKKISKAETYFKKVLEQNNMHGDSYFYLGLIDLKRKKNEIAFVKFYNAAKFFLQSINRIEEKLQNVKNLKVSEIYKKKRRQKLKKYLKNIIKSNMESLLEIITVFKNGKNPKLKHINTIFNEIKSKYKEMEN